MALSQNGAQVHLDLAAAFVEAPVGHPAMVATAELGSTASCARAVSGAPPYVIGQFIKFTTEGGERDDEES